MTAALDRSDPSDLRHLIFEGTTRPVQRGITGNDSPFPVASRMFCVQEVDRITRSSVSVAVWQPVDLCVDLYVRVDIETFA